MGAPTVDIEKLCSVADMHYAVEALENHLGYTATAIMAAEIGGLNSVMPVAYAAMRGLPLIDADGMGRAFPSLHMTSFNVHGVSCTPMALSDEHGNVVIFRTKNAETAEELSRPVVTAMGASASLSEYPMSGLEAKAAALPDTVSAAIAIGAAVRSDDKSVAAIDRLLAALRSHSYYRHAYRIFDGKITELSRDTSRGWVFGRCTVSALQGSSEAEICFQNENTVVRVDGVLRAVVPDLICIVDRETAQPITTEALRYGQRVAIVGCSAPPQLRTPEALVCMGPSAFGENVDYVAIERLAELEPAAVLSGPVEAKCPSSAAAAQN